MKKTTAIILILSVMLIAVSGILFYEIMKDDWNITVVKPDQSQTNNENNNKDDEPEKPTQIDEDSAIVKEEVVIIPENDQKPVKEEYDLIVFGAEPEGIAGAIAGARNGLKVLLVERRDGPGGLMTYGMLNTIDMNLNDDGVLLNKGIFEEFYKQLGRTSFDVAEAKKIFQDMLDTEENITQMYEVENIEIGATETEVTYAIIDGDKYVATNYMDCTQDADITVAAGAEYTIGWEDVNEKNKSMSATLVIKMDNVDWEKMCKHIDDAKIPGTGHTDYGVWAFGEITKKYVPRQTHMRLKALNIGKQNDGSVLINSLQIIGINTLDEEEREAAYEKCVEEAKYLAKFLAENVPGFENATLGGVADELYVRETRHIIGEYRLTVKDMLESTYNHSAIAMASYPIDIQTTSIYDWGYVIAAPDQYYLPFGVIVPKGYTNLLTAGRSSSYTSIASGSARVIPTGMSLAESGALACAMSSQRGLNMQEILSSPDQCAELQQKIRVNKGHIDTASRPIVKKSAYYKYILEMCEKGILSLGYNNEFNPDEIVSETDFIILTKTYLKRSFIREELWNTDHINLLDVPEKAITPNRVKEIVYDITTYNIKDKEKRMEIENFLNDVVPTSTQELSLTRVYEILVEFKDFLIEEQI
ncbi:MAG: FAD-dependent oxidoreductase [Clostridia bacterium]|nr:FAD-dependent oxidoreductase [Clostridia bacterium]